MAIQYEDQVKRTINGTSLTITPKEDESIRVKGVYFGGTTADTVAYIQTDRVTVGYLLARFATKYMFNKPLDGSSIIDVYKSPTFQDIDLSYPVANGETLEITTTVACDIYIVYDIYDAGEVKNTEVNGSKADTFNYLCFLTNSAAWNPGTSEAYKALDKIKNPSDFPKFPLEQVPAGQEFDIHALGFTALGRGDGSVNLFRTEHLRMRYNREVLFSENKEGWIAKGDATHTAASYDYVAAKNELPYQEDYIPNGKRFTNPLTFIQGDTVDFEVGAISTAAGTVEAEKMVLWLLMTQRRRG